MAGDGKKQDRVVRKGKKGTMVLTSNSIPLVLKAVNHALAQGVFGDSEKPLVEREAQRLQARLP